MLQSNSDISNKQQVLRFLSTTPETHGQCSNMSGIILVTFWFIFVLELLYSQLQFDLVTLNLQ